MSYLHNFLGMLAGIAIMLSLASCGTAPSLRDSKVLAQPDKKISGMQLIYRKAEMKTVSTLSYGRGGVSQTNTGFDKFGDIVVKQANETLGKQGINVVEAKTIEGKEPIAAEAVPKDSSGTRLPILTISPVSGTIQANNHATRASYVFSVLLVDLSQATPKVLWRSTVDTSTWVGQDFLMKNVEKTVYDEKYAAQLLDAITNQLRADNLI